MYHKSLKAYTTNNLQSEMSVADPHRVIQLMMQGTLERLVQDSLDLSQGKISEDLFALYEYMKQQLWTAATDLDIAKIDEVANLLITIKSAWDQIPEAEKEKGYSIRQQQGDLG